MKSCLNQDTLKSTATDAVIRVAKKTDYAAIEFAQDKIEAIVKEGKLKNLVRLVKEQEIEIASVQGPEAFNLLSESEFASMIERTKALAEVAREVGTNVLVPVPSMMPDGVNPEKAESSTVDSILRLAKACGEDIKLGVEFLGFKNCSLNSLDQAIRVIEKVDLWNVGLTIDTFHMYISGSSPVDLTKIGKSKLVLVHVNDSEPGVLSKLSDSDRVFLGEGVIDLKRFREALLSVSYDSYISLELLRPEYWERNPEGVARMGRAGVAKIFKV